MSREEQGCSFPYAAGSVKNRSLNEVQRRKAKAKKSFKEEFKENEQS